MIGGSGPSAVAPGCGASHSSAASDAASSRLALKRRPRASTSTVDGRGREPRRAAHPGAADTAIPPRVLREVLLVIVLGVVELRRLADLRRDRSVARLAERALICRGRRLRRDAL